MIGDRTGRARILAALLLLELGCGQVERDAASRGTGGEASSPTDSLSGGSSFSGGSLGSGGSGTPSAGSPGELGGTGGTQGTAVTAGTGGSEPGSNGNEGGAVGSDPDAEQACTAYCGAYAAIRPEAGLGPVELCFKQCVLGVSQANAECRIRTLVTYRCISDAFARASAGCASALLLATRDCDQTTVEPCHEDVCNEQISGDGLGNVTALAECDNGSAELYCSPSRTGNATCVCSIDGVAVFETVTGFISAKSAVLNSNLFDLCKRQL